MLSLLAGLSNMVAPSGAVVGNLPPRWDLGTVEFTSQARIDLQSAFFDPDGDALSFGIEATKGATAFIDGQTLVANGKGSIIVSASDGKSLVSREIYLI